LSACQRNPVQAILIWNFYDDKLRLDQPQAIQCVDCIDFGSLKTHGLDREL